MNAIVNVMLSNAVVVTVLFCVLMLLRRWIRNPAVFHGLAVLLLVKLLVPWGWQPTLNVLPHTAADVVEAQTAESPTSAHAGVHFQPSTPPDIESMPIETEIVDVEVPATIPALPDAPDTHRSPPQGAGRATESPRWTLRPAFLIGLAWLIGTTFWLLISVRRIVAFRKSLRLASPAPAELQELAATLAHRLGLKRSPHIVLVPGQLSPVLWSLGGRPQIILSAGLLDRLDDGERRSLLLHELAHYRRGDHWVRLVELAATGLYWWYPVSWWLRRELRLAEELCCDAWVVESLPDQRRAYAEALVKTAGWLSAPALVPGSTGIGSTHGIEQRITRIMRDSPVARVPRGLKALIAILAVGLLSCAPMVGPSSAEPTEQAAVGGDGDQNTEGPAEIITGRIVTPEGQPVSEMTVEAYVNGEPWDTPFVSDEQGAIQVPADWRFDEKTRNQVLLVARDRDERLGWYGFRPNEPEAPAPFAFQMVLLPRDRVVQGRFVNDNGGPVAGVRVVVDSIFQEQNGYVGDYLLGESRWLPSIPSDQSGQFSIPMPEGSRVRLRVDDPDWVRMEIPADETTDDLGRLTLYPAGRIEGRVVNAETGEPMAGHTIFVQALNSENLREGFPSYAAAKVDDEGRYVIGGLPPAPFNVLHGSPHDQRQWTAPAHEHVDVVAGQATTVDFQVIRGQRLAGRVTEHPTGKPLANISVGYYGSARPDSGAACMMVRTDENGAYEFFVPPGASRVYVAEGNRQRLPDSRRTVMVSADRPLGPVDLTAGPLDTGTFGESAVSEAPRAPGAEPEVKPYDASVRLVPPEGMSVTNVEVRTVFSGSQFSAMWCARSGEQFTIPFHEREDGGKVFLLIDARGLQPLRSPEFTVAEEMPELVVPLSPEVRVPIRGRAVDRNGDPVPGARVRIRRNLYGREMQFPWGLEYTTNDRGEFEIEHVRVSERVQLRIDGEGVGTVVTDWIEPADAEPVALGDVVVAPPDQVVGGIVRDYDGFPVPDARVSLRENPDVTTETDAEGAFRLVGVPMGELELTVVSAGFPEETRKATGGVLDNEIHVHRISDQDRKDYQVAVHLETSDDSEPKNVTLYWCEEGGRHLSTMPGREGHDFTIGFARNVRRAEGRRFVVIARAEGYAMSQPAVVPNQRNPDPVTIRLNAAPAVSIRGRVVNVDGRPVQGARVGTSLKLTDEDNDEPWHFFGAGTDLPQTDAEGRFEIDGLQAGSQMAVYVNQDGYAGVWSERVTLTDAVTTLPDLVLPEGTSEIAGRVVDESGSPVAGAVVTLLDLGSVRMTTDAEGRFRFPNLGPREYPMRASGEAGEWYDRVEAGTLDVEARLSPRR